MNLREMLSRRPVASYFVLVFLIAWGAVVAVVGPRGLMEGATPRNWQLMPVFGAMLLGPAVAGLVLLALADGKDGLHDLWMRQRRWRVAPRWYGMALLTTPVLLLAILWPLSMVASQFTPGIFSGDNVIGVLAFGLVVGVFAGFMEEIGWTGFVLPRLRCRHAFFAAGLLLGILWGIWHALADYWGTHVEYGDLWSFRIALWTAALTAYRILMVWVYENARSLLVAQLMHASFTGSQGILVPALAPADHFVWYGVFTIALWAMVAGVALTNRQKVFRSHEQ